MCVSVLSHLCTVMPNMYRVGVSKASPTPKPALEDPKFRNVPIPVRETIQMSLACGMLIPAPDLCSSSSCCLIHCHLCFHFSKVNSSFQPSPVCSVSVCSWRKRARNYLKPVPCPQLFLKEHLHQLLESMREHVLNRAALTLQRCLRGFFIQRRFHSLRRTIILLQSRARGYLAR